MIAFDIVQVCTTFRKCLGPNTSFGGPNTPSVTPLTSLKNKNLILKLLARGTIQGAVKKMSLVPIWSYLLVSFEQLFRIMTCDNNITGTFTYESQNTFDVDGRLLAFDRRMTRLQDSVLFSIEVGNAPE